MSAAAAVPLIQARSERKGQQSNAGDPDSRAMLGGTSFYRRQTESLLRRYMRASMEMGRTPSVLGTSVFRGRASSYRLRTFEDCIIFIFDVEKCLKRLDSEARDLIAKIALQEYTYAETAKLTQQSERSVGRKYALALDHLTGILLDAEILNPWHL